MALRTETLTPFTMRFAVGPPEPRPENADELYQSFMAMLATT